VLYLFHYALTNYVSVLLQSLSVILTSSLGLCLKYFITETSD